MALYVQFQVDPPASVLASMQEELSAIMGPVGFRFEWRSLPKVAPGETSVELAVINFKGRCEFSGMNPLSHNRRVLGETYVERGAIIPFSDIDCDQIRAFIQRDLAAERSGRRQSLFGRAVARVLAHELYHILANTANHGSRGLSKSTYNPGDLLADLFPIEPRAVIALQSGQVMANLKNIANQEAEQ